MFKNIAVAFSHMFIPSSTEDNLVRMFRTEYNKEYRYAVKNGVNVTSKYVRDFLADYKN